MGYSFTTPKKKQLFETNTKIWIGVFFVSILILLSFNIFLSVTQSNMVSKRDILTQKRTKTVQDIEVLKEQFADYKAKVEFKEEIDTHNKILTESIRNLFELIPDQITINSVKMDSNRLEIRGITPSREIYEFLLAAPLKSIFSSSKVSFYRLSNGWYNFVSVNKIDESGAIFE